ncbi:MAG: hypothetical protein ACC633_04235 [Anaerolineales bacterium]
MSPTDERLEILEMIQRGTISPQEGLNLIEALGETWEEELESSLEMNGGESESLLPAPNFEGEDFKKWRDWWIIPFWLGVGITTLGGALMYWAWSANGLGVGFVLAWFPFLIGVGIMVLGWNSKTGLWVHIRIHQKPGETPKRIAISLPIPIRFFAWTIRTFGSFIPGLDTTGIDEVILALGNNSPGDLPLSINVRDDEDGEQVEVYIG